MVPPSSAHHYAVGVKELIGLPPAVIADRFNLSGNEGAAWLFAGSPSDGLMGGGFLYTNQTPSLWGWCVVWGILPMPQKVFHKCWKTLSNIQLFDH